jgi:2-keto-4-pentenoate hydratase/2-oxohepta-3-ene-1,7-dioic acid hydratase in catechol pathway
VLARRAKDVTASQAADYVWGITLLNDWSIRGADKSRESLSLNLSKNFEGSASVGPAILVGEIDVQNVDVEVHVNGQSRQHYNSRDMIFSFAEYLEYLSKDLALLPGDMISGGSGPGSAIDSSRLRPGGEKWPEDLERDLFLKPGDVVEVSSPGIGTLRNRVVAKA